jgi:hypothetical protein
MPRTRHAHTMGEWEKLTGSVTPEIAAGRPHLEGARARLGEIEAEVARLTRERAALEAKKQDATRRIKHALVEGRKVASALRAGLKFEYGHQNEELVAFGVKPLRSRKGRRKTKSAGGDSPD